MSRRSACRERTLRSGWGEELRFLHVRRLAQVAQEQFVGGSYELLANKLIIWCFDYFIFTGDTISSSVLRWSGSIDSFEIPDEVALIAKADTYHDLFDAQKCIY
jgi:hypothetical protein